MHSSVFWCAGSWNLTCAQLAKLRGVQSKMIRKMLRIKRRTDESLDGYMIWVANTISNLRAKHGIEAWDAAYHRSVFKWGGHLARLQLEDADRMSYQAFAFKNWQWIQNQSDERGNQWHCRKLRVWRWERPFYKFFAGQVWEQFALDANAWKSTLDEIVAWRLQVR